MFQSIAEQIVRDATSISHSLNSNYIKMSGLEVLVANELERLCKPKGITSQVTVEGNLEVLEAEKKLLIYRIETTIILPRLMFGSASYLI